MKYLIAAFLLTSCVNPLQDASKSSSPQANNTASNEADTTVPTEPEQELSNKEDTLFDKQISNSVWCVKLKGSAYDEKNIEDNIKENGILVVPGKEGTEEETSIFPYIASNENHIKVRLKVNPVNDNDEELSSTDDSKQVPEKFVKAMDDKRRRGQTPNLYYSVTGISVLLNKKELKECSEAENEELCDLTAEGSKSYLEVSSSSQVVLASKACLNTGENIWESEDEGTH